MNHPHISLQAVQRWWTQRSVREQRWVWVATVALVGWLVWALACAPAWRTLRVYPEQRAILDTQLQSMQALQARARTLKDQPAWDGRAAQAALQTSVGTLGAQAKLVMLGGQATVTLQGVEAKALAQWLASTRTDAHLTPTQAKLARDGSAWTGTVVFTLPGS
ncbi:MAG: type II secretion system protein GspM [Rhodoferax sp.]|nr:type II secretion system protein GspM [Rhodoferax sp.]